MKKSQAIARLRQVIRRQHKALATEDSYVCELSRPNEREPQHAYQT